MPLSTLRLTPRGVNRKTQGQDGVRSLLSCRALSSPTTYRFIPAHPRVGIRSCNPYVNNFQSRSRKSEVCDLFFCRNPVYGQETGAACLPGRAVWKRCDEGAEAAPGEKSCWLKSAGIYGLGLVCKRISIRR